MDERVAAQLCGDEVAQRIQLVKTGRERELSYRVRNYASMSPQDALRTLMDGNARFVAGAPRARSTVAGIARLVHGQAPFATLLACADSRVPVETIFDHDAGDIFVVRLAGNFVSDAALGSIEYGTAVLRSPLIMVLGHTSCGAVKAGMDFVENGTPLPGNIQLLADATMPAARATRATSGDWWHEAVVENVRRNVETLQRSRPLIAEAVASGDAQVVGAVYELQTGAVHVV